MSLKKPFGWKGFARFEKIVRGVRMADLTRLPRAHRPAAIVVVVIGVLATAMLITAHQSSTRRDTKPAPRTVAAAAAPESAARPAAATSTPAVTITGCLQHDDETFRLKDTEGADAPKSRSWKSGFLKKGSASIEVVDAANRLKLTNYVGQRISLTGVLVDREMQARTLHRVASSCSDKPAKSDAL